MIVRVWRMVEILQRSRNGLTVTALAAEAGISRSTAYRYVALLERAGAPIAVQGVNGEARYTLAGGQLPALGPGSPARIALGVARELLAPLEGTDGVEALDQLIARANAASERAQRAEGPEGRRARTGGFRAGPANPAISAPHKKRTHDTAVARAVERALAARSQLMITYRGVDRRVEPAAFRVAGAHAYLVAWDPDKQGWRTFKLARIERAEILTRPVAPHPAFDEQQLFGRSVRVWHGEPVDVRVRLSPEVAAVAREYPLIDDQRLIPEPDGGVIVEATVSGTVEATRWVLAWGRAAEALEPAELREAVQAELGGALARYAGPGVVKGREGENQAVSRMVRRGRGR